MDKKKLILITYDKLNSDHYKEELTNFFGDEIIIETQNILDGIKENLEGDVVLSLSPLTSNFLIKHFKEDIEIIHGTKALSKLGYEKMMKLPPGTKSLLMTTNKTSAFEMATYLYKIVINHIDFVPTYPDCDEIYDLDTAITPGQIRFIPKYIKNIVDLGWRKISLDTYMSLLVVLKLKNEKFIEKLYKLSKETLSHDFLNTSLDNISKLKTILYMTIDEIGDGLIFFNTFNKVTFVNKSLLNMLGLDEKLIKSPSLMEYMPNSFLDKITKNLNIDNMIIYIDEIDKKFILSKKPFYLYKNIEGCLITLKDVNNIEILEQKIRSDSVKRGYVAKYKFNNIIGNSSIIKDCIKKAKKMALTDNPILITGETGTGKEAFTQSIHNHSNRKNKPFVAINCASLPSELLESELFGYEDGSFTGAKKGGKKGLFELAHTGTIFLDEIGDMPHDLQVKLLRVLQEKEIRKIGGTSIIPIDVRILAATNKDLEKLIIENKFRMDLFYRISMFTLDLPPLRKRLEDIPLLLESFLKELPYKNIKLDKSLLEALNSYTWMGNIRELRNCIEYMAYMGSNYLTINDLPQNISSKLNNNHMSSNMSIFNDLNQYDKNICISILKSLHMKPMGRTKLMKFMEYNVTEYEVRNMLEYLTRNGYLISSKGRKGSSITEKGIKIIENNII
ncbi:sigma 54-interacting transcriptional regulator [Clostridioides difficile]|uniref:Sigma54-interacting regulatory protein n=1 Tax=Clostridioides difficile ATCC 9689 = DSM 1296 TaxID=1121308 RepID=A0AC59G2A2_CLODI|nr:sigma 54-interacting transcriptional regulator [Clostridioides difficile]AKP43660.1 sigma54-interacting regulatory protein [Clostridioides difficile ATCC 9689 = DSM 1296]ARC16134.1 AAA family ATPase [Clostridioides difficile]AVI13210.1 AAA family ATPase [Clostridioides difficile]EGT4119725.1 AAA family ATPase [Clostridioides difficile]EJX2685290.1 sigma 54-interacting transcriptional regulator [Clostridioides difficile]